MREKYNFEIFPVLENERLFLREIDPSEASEIIELSAYDGFFAKTTEDVLEILSKIKNDYINGDGVSWGIYLKETGKIAGTCCYCRGYKNNVGEIGYVLKEAYRGKNIMTEATKMITDFGLHVMNLDTVVAYTDPENKKSRNVLDRLGFIQSDDRGETIQYSIKKSVKKLSKKDLKTLLSNIKKHGRHLEYLMISHLFDDKSKEIIAELKNYQNDDGGFGNALEPDLRVPDSSGVATEFAINILSRLTETDDELVTGVVKYLENSFDESKGYWEITPENVDEYPRAVWWNREDIELFGKHNPAATLLGFLYKHRDKVTELNVDKLIDQLMKEIADMPVERIEAHTIFCLIDLMLYLPKDRTIALNDKINETIKYTIELDDSKWKTYAPEPIKYISHKQHDLYSQFSSVIETNLNALIESVNDRKYWDTKHTWHQYDDYFAEHVKDEWAGIFTYDNLKRLINFDRIEQ